MIGIIIFSILLLNSTFSMLTVLLPLLIFQIDNSTAQVELVLMVFMVFLLITRIILLLKQYDFKKFLIIGSLTYCLGFLILVFTNEIFLYYIGAGLFGFSFAILTPLLLTYLSQILKNATTIYNLLIAFSAAVSPLIGEKIYLQNGHSITLIWLFISALCLLLNFLIAIKSPKIQKAGNDTHGITKNTIAIFKEIFIALLLISIPYGAIITYLPLYFSNTRYSVGVFYSLFWLSYAVASYINHKITSRFGKEKIKITSILFMIISLILLVFMENKMLIYVSSILFGFGFGSLFNVYYDEVSMIKNDFEKNNGYAIIGLMSYVGVGIAPMILFSFSKNLGHTFLVSISFLVIAIGYSIRITTLRERRLRN